MGPTLVFKLGPTLVSMSGFCLKTLTSPVKMLLHKFWPHKRDVQFKVKLHFGKFEFLDIIWKKMKMAKTSNCPCIIRIDKNLFSSVNLALLCDAFSQFFTYLWFLIFDKNFFPGDRQTSLQIYYQSNWRRFGKANFVHQFDCANGKNPRKLSSEWTSFCVSNLRQRTISSKFFLELEPSFMTHQEQLTVRLEFTMNGLEMYFTFWRSFPTSKSLNYLL